MPYNLNPDSPYRICSKDGHHSNDQLTNKYVLNLNNRIFIVCESALSGQFYVQMNNFWPTKYRVKPL